MDLSLRACIGRRARLRPIWQVILGLLILTALFDPLIIYAGIVEYDYAKTLGARLAGAPIEDFIYAITAAFLVPHIWEKLDARHK